jgi:hypothetical protein
LQAISPLLRRDFAQSPAGRKPNGDLTDSIVPSDGTAVPPSSDRTPHRCSALVKVVDMQTRPTIEPTGSPIPGVIPGPVRVDHGTVGATKPASSPGRRNPASTVLARLLGAIRGDKYMVDAYLPAGHRTVDTAVARHTKER